MRLKRHSKCVWLAGASAMVIGLAAPVAIAQEETDDIQRTLSTVTVTTQKTEESIQDVPIAVSAFDEAALDKMQLAGGPDLVKSIPNVNFTKGNFTGYNFRIRGIGVDAVSTSGDAGVGVHINDVPLTANAFFEAEFYDVERIETLRGPQGTLYGRNATGGVVNMITAKPVLGEWQGNVKATVGNYNTHKFKGMLNAPLGDTAALRIAGSYLERDGYVDNLTTQNDIDDRNLYAIRGSFAWEPTDRFRGLLMAEYFKEDDNRLRSGKQYCKKDPTKTSFGGIPISAFDQIITSQGCVEADINDPASLGGVNTAGTLAGSLGILAGLVGGIDANGNAINVDANTSGINPGLRTLESFIDPTYESEQTLYMWRGEYDLTDALTLTYLGSYNEYESISQEDYNEYGADVNFNTAASPFIALNGATAGAFAALYPSLFPGGVVADPQMGLTTAPVATDISGAYAEQTTHEVRLQSDFDGRFNFNLGAIKVDYETNTDPKLQESYYVMFNAASAFIQLNNAASLIANGVPAFTIADPANAGETPIDNLNGNGRNYFRSITPYTLDSFAVFGEGYYDVTDDLQLTVGLRYTSDDKEVGRIPTFLLVPDAVRPDPLAYVPVPGASNDLGGDGTYNVTFEEVTGRVGLDWSPELSFTEDTLIYGFYSRGYKGGGINPPQPADTPDAFPQFFDPEFINSYEIGTKNTLAGGALQLNATGFMYDYEGYQISQIVNRSSANFNVDAKINGFELETVWNPVSTFVLNANLGLLDAKVKDTYGIDVLDRTNGRADLVTLKTFPSASNCVVSAQGYATVLGAIQGGFLDPGSTLGLCTGDFVGQEAALGLGGVTVSYVDSDGVTQTVSALTPFDGEAKNLDGNKLPGTPDTTFSFGAEYTWLPSGQGTLADWSATARVDYYYQADSYSRVWNTGRDQLESWDNINLSLRFNNEANNVSVEIFGKNIADDDVITGAYLTDDSSGLFTNVFLNEPRTFGISVSKTW